MSEQDKSKKAPAKKVTKKASVKKASVKEASAKKAAPKKVSAEQAIRDAAARAESARAEARKAEQLRQDEERAARRKEEQRLQDEADMAFGEFLGHAASGLGEACAAGRAAGKLAKVTFETWKRDAKRDLAAAKKDAKEFVENNPALSATIATVASTALVVGLVKVLRRRK